MAGVARFITGHERSLLLRFLRPWDLANQNLFIFTAAGIVLCGGHKTSPRISL